MDGVDLSGHGVGDIVDVSPTDAQLLIAEQWAVPEEIVGAVDVAHDRGPTGRGRGRTRADRS